MKPSTPLLLVVTATANLAEAKPRIERWRDRASFEWPLLVVENGGKTDHWLNGGPTIIHRTEEWLGSVPAMAKGIALARDLYKPLVIAALHDDVEIEEPGWDVRVLDHFTQFKRCGLAGFSGATGLGDDEIYLTPYQPMQLARRGFRSNLVDAEAHGERSTRVERVVCHDGFSLIGRATWWYWGTKGDGRRGQPPWEVLRATGIKHHCYDSLLGVLAAKASWESWYLPVACRHLGGRTAVANREYQQWAMTQVDGGDAGFWHQAHEIGYELGRGILPLRMR